MFGTLGLTLAIWTVRLFLTIGRGTPAPWAPPENLVVRGPYRHVRNPMIVGVICIVCAEALLIGSSYLFGWALVFLLMSTLYFIKVEEPSLEGRFGDPYRIYKANVPRWIPRWRPWQGSE